MFRPPKKKSFCCSTLCRQPASQPASKPTTCQSIDKGGFTKWHSCCETRRSTRLVVFLEEKANRSFSEKKYWKNGFESNNCVWRITKVNTKHIFAITMCENFWEKQYEDLTAVVKSFVSAVVACFVIFEWNGEEESSSFAFENKTHFFEINIFIIFPNFLIAKMTTSE